MLHIDDNTVSFSLNSFVHHVESNLSLFRGIHSS